MCEQDYTDSPEGQNAIAQAYEDARLDDILNAPCGRCGDPTCFGGCELAQSADARLTPVEGSQASGSATESDLRNLRTQIAHLTEERDQAQHYREEPFADCVRLTAEKKALTEVHERLMTLSAKWTQQRDTFAADADAARLGDNEQRRIAGAIATVCQAHISELDALLSPREGTQHQIDQEDKAVGLPGSADTKGVR